ncbi:MAG: RES domain-containing protein, partial [Rhizobiales bacterium]|nr:RES domain-containing protein [Hyphomicrobiales bacterium]
MASYCCAECFDDRGLRKNIIPSKNPFRGTCSFCGSADVELVEPHELSDVFELLVNAYAPDPNGKLLVEWMKEDWQLFTHPRMDIAHAKELLSEILDDGDIPRSKFSPSTFFKGEILFHWET